MSQQSWLLSPPEDFNTRCKGLASADEPANQIARLASYDVSANQANRLMRTIGKLDNGIVEQVKGSYARVKLGLVSNGTTDLMPAALFVAALRHGVWLEIISADFDQALQESLDPTSQLNQAQLDLVLLNLDYRGFNLGAKSYAVHKEGMDAQEALAYLNQIRSGFRQHSGANCIVQTLAHPPISLLGALDTYLINSVSSAINAFNQTLISEIQQDSDYLFDVARMAADAGQQTWFDDRQWLLSRIQMSSNALPVYADRLGSLLGAIRGKSKKCLVLDLDNTVWGGVIGDDGMDGIQIAEGHPRGEAHLALQRYALELKDHGIVLAVCSKNDEKNALQPFKEHPDMLLRESDIAVFVANWNDKASNLQYIADTLNIGIDALVFVDDNPAEREIIRQHLPQVAVPELPSDPSYYVRNVAMAGYFEAVAFNQEDRQRAEQYRQNSQRNALLNTASDMDEYLKSLEMKISLMPFDKLGRKRITQLINKTNQFNLTTKRYTEEQVEQFEASPEHLTLQIRLKDRFGDNGMICVVIAEQRDDALHIDSWLMSCRVIKRNVEHMVCDYLVEYAQSNGLSTIHGQYIPSPKNNLVKAHFAELGFEKAAEQGEVTHWRLEVSDYEFNHPPMERE